MARERFRLNQTIALIRDHGPISPNALTELTGDWRQTIDRYIRLAHKAGLIHVHSYGPSPFGGNRTVKLWAYGPGEDAKRPRVRGGATKPSTPKPSTPEPSTPEPAPIRVRRDPMVEALFGAATC